ncbi:MAG: efflux RND transporter periplasmic adaptor subunit [Inquilinaceae bacterium]
MRRSWLLAILIAAVAAGWMLSGRLDGGESAPVADGTPAADPAPAEPAVQVRVAQIQAEPMIDQLVLQGRTMADRKVDIRAETYGVVEAILAERGALVEEGAILVRLSTEEREATLAEAQALLTQRQVEYDAASQLNQKGYRATTDLAQSQAALDAARAMVRLAELGMERITIAAPFGGVVNARPVEIGDFVENGDIIATIVDLDPVRVVGQISERRLGQVELGTVATVRLLDGSTVEGVVSFVGTVADAVTRTFPVEVEIPNPDRRIIEGVTAELELPIGRIMAHKVTPAILSLSDEGDLGVKAVDETNHVVFYPTMVLGNAEDGVWLGGLPPIVTVITVGQEFVKVGNLVDPVREDQMAGRLEGEAR